jgi:hypothetical protein
MSYVMGILNSRLFVLLYRLLALESGRVLAQVKPTVLAQLPIRRIDNSNRKEVSLREDVSHLVNEMTSLHMRLANMKTSHERVSLERQIAATDGEIDQLVYQLYGLTEEEIKIVEEATGK